MSVCLSLHFNIDGTRVLMKWPYMHRILLFRINSSDACRLWAVHGHTQSLLQIWKTVYQQHIFEHVCWNSLLSDCYVLCPLQPYTIQGICHPKNHNYKHYSYQGMGLTCNVHVNVRNVYVNTRYISFWGLKIRYITWLNPFFRSLQYLLQLFVHIFIQPVQNAKIW